MEKIITTQNLRKYAEEALIGCLDYIGQNMIYSPWTKRNAGWQEQWLQSKFAGLYGTCDALFLLAYHKDRYREIISIVAEELKYLFNNNVNYKEMVYDTEEEKQRKARCRFLLEQNQHITLKAVYFLRTIELLKSKDVFLFEDERMLKIIDSVYLQIESTYMEDGYFSPAVGNVTDNSILATIQAFMLMKNKWGMKDEKIQKTKDLLLSFIDDYILFMDNGYNSNKSKFDIYRIKSNFVAALYALSDFSQLSVEEIEKVVLSFFVSMNDQDIRKGFWIKDSYTVPDTILSRDTYIVDSRLLFLKSTIQLMILKIVPVGTIEFLIDDLIEIVDTCLDKKQYLFWDSAPSFSHNIRGLIVLQNLIYLLDDASFEFTACKIFPNIRDFEYRAIDPLNVVLFMSFSKEYTESVEETVREVLNYIGFTVWWATNDPYDAIVVDSIFDKLSKAQFVIIDCSERSANVMYEAGLSHGLGKPTLLCGTNDNVFPYEQKDFFDSCIFDSDGEKNPPPYRDLQRGILDYIKNNIDTFSLTKKQKKHIIEKSENFIDTFCGWE